MAAAALAKFGHLPMYGDGSCHTPMLKVLAARTLCRDLRAARSVGSLELFAQSLRDLYGAACVAIVDDLGGSRVDLAVPSSLLTAKWTGHLAALLERAGDPRPMLLSRADSKRLFKGRATMSTVLVPLEAPLEGDWRGGLVIAWAGEKKLDEEQMIALALLGQDLASSLDSSSPLPAPFCEPPSSFRPVVREGCDASKIEDADEDWLEDEKGEFLSLVAHELRTPLTPMTMLLQSLERKARDGVVDIDAIVRARRQASRLTALTSHLLDFSHLDTLTLERDVEPFDISSVLKSALESLQTASDQHVFETRWAHGALLVNGDKARLEHVFVNLLDNAIKYSPSGGTIFIEVSRTAGDVSIAIADEGIGIPKEQHEQLFARFFRAHNVSDRKFRGFGLGLHLAKAIVEKHGGQLSLTSELGQGSRFAVRLPLAEAPPAVLGRTGPARLLLADDDPDILQVAGDLLEGAGYEVLRARDGAEALHYVETGAPDLVLLDLMMPILNGWEVLERLRNGERWCPIPIVILSAHHKAPEHAEALHANAHLTKPFGVDTLVRMVEGMLSPPSPASEPPSAR